MVSKFPVIIGKVVKGNQEGRKIGFPSANLEVSLSKDDLKPGVYTAIATIDQKYPGKKFQGLVYFGPRLVKGERFNNFEVHLFNFEESIYGQIMKVNLLEFIRPPRSFTSFAKLKKALEKDKSRGLALLAT